MSIDGEGGGGKEVQLFKLCLWSFQLQNLKKNLEEKKEDFFSYHYSIAKSFTTCLLH